VVLSFGQLRKLVFGISPRDWAFSRRGFPEAAPKIRGHLEHIIATFVDSYHATLEDSRPEVLMPRLNSLTPEFRGFAFEGVALCLTMFDFFTPWKRDRWRTFRNGPGEPHSFLMHVGFGLALARLGRPAGEALTRLTDPGERWLAVDGYGFHEGFFRWRQFVENQTPPARLTGYAARVFDQGLGRCLWFGYGADVERIGQAVASFPAHRRRDLWSGLGVASTYAGGVGESDLKALAELATPHQAHLRQGSVFAVKLRHRAGNVVAHTELACQVLSGLSVAEAVRLVDTIREGLPPDSAQEPAYEVLRRRVQDQLASTMELHK
jgi:enediyne biosynthesis protein E3